LVLNWGDGTLSSPVNGVSEVGFIEDLWLLGTKSEGSVVTKHLLPFLRSVGGELVEANGVFTLKVVLFNEGEGRLELFSSEIELSSGSVGLTIFGDPLHELVVGSLHLEESAHLKKDRNK